MPAFRPSSLALTLAFVAIPAFAAPAIAQDDPTVDTPIARAAELTLGVLLPADLPETAFVSVSTRANEAEGPFEASFEALLPGNLILTVLVSDREMPLTVIGRLFEPGPMRDAVVDDEAFGERDCAGSTEQVSITCRIGSGLVQVTGSSITEEPFPYEDLKAMFETIDMAAIEAVLAPRGKP